MFPEKNCCIHRPKRIEASDFNIVDGELKRTQNVVVPVSRAETESNNWESDHSTYFICITFSLFEHLELLALRATSTAGKTMLFL